MLANEVDQHLHSDALPYSQREEMNTVKIESRPIRQP